MGHDSSKESRNFYVGLTIHEQIQVLELWNKMAYDIPKHNQCIVERYFQAYSDHKKYFVAVTKCNPNNVALHPRVISHWESVLELIGNFITGPFTKRKNVEQKLMYIALLHKDIGLAYSDFEKYTTILVAHLINDSTTRPHITPLTETCWSILVNSIFKLIEEKLQKIYKMERSRDSSGNEIIVTPELLKLKQRRKSFLGCTNPMDPWLESYGLFIDQNFNSQEYWIARREFWIQQKYWFEKIGSFSNEEVPDQTLLAIEFSEEKDESPKITENGDFMKFGIDDSSRANSSQLENEKVPKYISTQTIFGRHTKQDKRSLSYSDQIEVHPPVVSIDQQEVGTKTPCELDESQVTESLLRFLFEVNLSDFSVCDMSDIFNRCQTTSEPIATLAEATCSKYEQTFSAINERPSSAEKKLKTDENKKVNLESKKDLDRFGPNWEARARRRNKFNTKST